MKIDVIIAAAVIGLAIYTIVWRFTVMNNRIYLPKPPRKRRFFDGINERRPNFFRTLSAALGALSVLLVGHDQPLWIIMAALFVPVFGVYLFTCVRSYFLINSDFGKYYED